MLETIPEWVRTTTRLKSRMRACGLAEQATSDGGHGVDASG
jgi:hypothetical protein